MVLVQKRVVLLNNIKKECQKLNIRIRSSDELLLQTDILISDILSLAKCFLYPKDQFNLACLLKSDFFSCK